MNDTPNPNGVGIPLPEASALSLEQWREKCLELLAERGQLRAEIAQFRLQSQQLIDMWFPEDAKEVTFSTEELLAQRVTEPSLLEVIDNLERSLASAK
jgi:chorismate mutase